MSKTDAFWKGQYIVLPAGVSVRVFRRLSWEWCIQGWFKAPVMLKNVWSAGFFSPKRAVIRPICSDSDSSAVQAFPEIWLLESPGRRLCVCGGPFGFPAERQNWIILFGVCWKLSVFRGFILIIQFWGAFGKHFAGRRKSGGGYNRPIIRIAIHI